MEVPIRPRSRAGPEPDPEPDPDPSGISLSGSGSKVQGRWVASLSWSGASGSQVDIYGNGSKLTTVNNTGSYTDNTTFRGGGSLTYQVCEAGSSTCSSTIAISF